MEDDSAFLKEKNNNSIVKPFIYSLIVIIILGSVALFFVFELLSAAAWGGDNSLIYLFVVVILLSLLIIFILIIRKFKKRYIHDNKGKNLLFFLLIIPVILPFIIGFALRMIYIIQDDRLDRILEKADQCDQDLYGSIVEVKKIIDSHKVGDPFILLELDLLAKKEAILSLYTHENSLFYTKWRHDIVDKRSKFTEDDSIIIIPAGRSTAYIMLDTSDEGLKVGGPYNINLNYELLSEESRCRYDLMGSKQIRGYNPDFSLTPGGYKTQPYSWKDF